jgi:hypothetical protein
MAASVCFRARQALYAWRGPQSPLGRVQRSPNVPGRLAASVGGLSIDKNVTVVESWFYTAAETTDYGSVSTDRDSARLAINAAQGKPLGTI